MKSIKFIFNIFFLFFLISCSSQNIDDDEEEEVVEEINSKTPNIVFIIADDFGRDASINYPEGTVKPDMPNLQNLMNTGITFDNFWVNPICSPTRASILTGKYGLETGVLRPGDEISISETSLQNFINTNSSSDYATAIIGKWHLSRNANDPITMGIDYFAGILRGGVSDYYNWDLNENGISTTSTIYTTTKLTDLAISWKNEQEKPWFLWLAYNAPHTPFHLAPSNLHNQGDLPTDNAAINANPLPYYISAIEAMDAEMGRFLNSLSTEEKENTVIIFIGDNGTPARVAQNPFGRSKSKDSMYEGGVNVPMVISGININRINERENTIINGTDLYTTIANIAGVSTTSIYNSQSFYNLLNEENSGLRDVIYTENGGDDSGFAIRNLNYKLIKFDNGTEEFYNLNQDPYENNNLIGTTLSSEALAAKVTLETEANNIRN